MSNFSQIKKQFNSLSPSAQKEILKDLYNFSKDTRLFLESRLLGGSSVADEYLQQMERETIGKIYRKSMPETPNGRVVRAILSKAHKANVGLHTMMALEQLAYRGFIEFLNEFGGGPESFDEQACNHLETYLRLVKEYCAQEERKQIFQEVNDYLCKKNNMVTDTLYDTYYEVTGD